MQYCLPVGPFASSRIRREVSKMMKNWVDPQTCKPAHTHQYSSWRSTDCWFVFQTRKVLDSNLCGARNSAEHQARWIFVKYHHMVSFDFWESHGTSPHQRIQTLFASMDPHAPVLGNCRIHHYLVELLARSIHHLQQPSSIYSVNRHCSQSPCFESD